MNALPLLRWQRAERELERWQGERELDESRQCESEYGRASGSFCKNGGLTPAVKVVNPVICHCGYRNEHDGKIGIIFFKERVHVPSNADKMFFNFCCRAYFFKKRYFFVSVSELRVNGSFKHYKRKVFHFQMDSEVVALG